MPTRIGTTNRLKGKQLMKLSHFFIDRPIFGIVISIVTVLLGAIAYTVLPVAQFPEIAPPTIVVQA
jgi:multidrug efflux pump subunit AcrB